MTRIPSLNPTSRPAQPALTYADSFIVQAIISAKPGAAWRAEFTTQNYDYVTGQIDPQSTSQSIIIPDLMAQAQRSTVVAQAMSAFLNAASLLIAEQKAEGAVGLAQSEEAILTAKAELAAIRAQLGVQA